MANRIHPFPIDDESHLSDVSRHELKSAEPMLYA